MLVIALVFMAEALGVAQVKFYWVLARWVACGTDAQETYLLLGKVPS